MNIYRKIHITNSIKIMRYFVWALIFLVGSANELVYATGKLSMETNTEKKAVVSVVEEINEASSKESESEIQWEYSVELDENTDDGKHLSEIDLRIEEYIDEINVENDSEVTELLQDMSEMFHLMTL